MSTEPNLQDYFPELQQTEENEHYQTFTFLKTLQHLNSNDTIDHQLFSFEDLMDIVAHPPTTTSSTYTQSDEPISTIEKHQNKRLVSNCNLAKLDAYILMRSWVLSKFLTADDFESESS